MMMPVACMGLNYSSLQGDLEASEAGRPFRLCRNACLSHLAATPQASGAQRVPAAWREEVVRARARSAEDDALSVRSAAVCHHDAASQGRTSTLCSGLLASLVCVEGGGCPDQLACFAPQPVVSP